MKTIEHKGIVKKINDSSIIVSIISNASCISCELNGVCSASDIEEKEVEVINYNGNYSVGEQVMVYFRESLGFLALFLGYILPFIILMIVLISFTSFGFTEGVSGLAALSSLVPYYAILYTVNKHLKKTFSFSIKKLKINNTLHEIKYSF